METIKAESKATFNDNAELTPDFGSGRYSPLMKSVFERSMAVFKLSTEAAEKLARQTGSDFGAAMRSSQVTASIGKSMSKDGKVTLAEAAKVKGVTATNALVVMRALQWIGDAGKFGISYGHTDWKPIPEIAKYLAELEK